MTSDRMNSSYWALRVTYTVVPLVAGIDKFTNLLTTWTMYLAPPIPQLLHVSPRTFMHVSGIVELAAGALMLTRWRRLGAFVVTAWLVGVSCNLAVASFFDVAVRDLAMAVGAFTLAQLELARAGATDRTLPVRGTQSTGGRTAPAEGARAH
jgi:uncharacterized membrane protein